MKPPDDPAALRLYAGATSLLEGLAPAFLRWRLRRGKEDAERLGERLGRTAATRPEGRLVWLHGASLGEGMALLPLVVRLRARKLAVLLTTGTVTSAAVLAPRLPAGVLHHFVPLDGPRAARRFLDHWRPDLVCFAESELWPNLLGEARRRGVPTALVNARMSARSFARWRRLSGFARPLVGGLDMVLAQTGSDAERYAALGGRDVRVTGNLKYDAEPPGADAQALRRLRDAVGARPLWVAASTHAGEDLACCAAHAALKAGLPEALLVIVPRRSERGEAIVAEAARRGLRAALRSRGALPAPDTDVYVADTMGELGLFYRLGAPVFVGKSLDPASGGQNPIEPAKLGNAVLHGPRVANFVDVYRDLDATGGGRVVADGPALTASLQALLCDPASATAQGSAARRGVEAAAGAAERTLAALVPILPASTTPPA